MKSNYLNPHPINYSPSTASSGIFKKHFYHWIP